MGSSAAAFSPRYRPARTICRNLGARSSVSASFWRLGADVDQVYTADVLLYEYPLSPYSFSLFCCLLGGPNGFALARELHAFFSSLPISCGITVPPSFLPSFLRGRKASLPNDSGSPLPPYLPWHAFAIPFRKSRPFVPGKTADGRM